MFLLRRYCGVSAHEALNVIPAWEYHLLVDRLRLEMQIRERERLDLDTEL